MTSIVTLQDVQDCTNNAKLINFICTLTKGKIAYLNSLRPQSQTISHLVTRLTESTVHIDDFAQGASSFDFDKQNTFIDHIHQLSHVPHTQKARYYLMSSKTQADYQKAQTVPLICLAMLGFLYYSTQSIVTLTLSAGILLTYVNNEALTPIAHSQYIFAKKFGTSRIATIVASFELLTFMPIRASLRFFQGAEVLPKHDSIEVNNAFKKLTNLGA